jgi:two-component system cell cycle response regulator DivK
MNKKILIAEDSSVILNLTRKILANQNYDTTVVKNGQEVLDHLVSGGYDMLLLDINMPVMNGIECAKKIRAEMSPEVKDIPIIAITGNAMNYSKEDFASVGINDFLPKPLNYDAMVTMVNRYFGK